MGYKIDSTRKFLSQTGKFLPTLSPRLMIEYRSTFHVGPMLELDDQAQLSAIEIFLY